MQAFIRTKSIMIKEDPNLSQCTYILHCKPVSALVPIVSDATDTNVSKQLLSPASRSVRTQLIKAIGRIAEPTPRYVTAMHDENVTLTADMYVLSHKSCWSN